MENTLLNFLISIEDKANENSAILSYEHLSTPIVQKMLLNFKEFEGVKKINVLKSPSFMADKKTRKPLEFDEDNLGETSNTKAETAVSYKYNYEELQNNFNEEIDIFSISLTPKTYKPEELTASALGCGVWTMPLIYNPESFTPYREIKIVFSPEGMQDNLALEQSSEVEKMLKERILKQVSDALDSYLEVNVPSHRGIIFRLSSRSIKKK